MRPLQWMTMALAPLLLVAACGGGDDDIDDRIDVADPKVRFIHAIPAGPSVTLFRNTAAQSDATNVSYKFASKYFDVETGPAQWEVNTTAGDVEIGSVSIDAKRGNKYTIVALPGDLDADLLAIRDPYNKGIVSDKARVRVVNASFTAQNVDVYLTLAGTDLASVNPTFSAVGYKSAVPSSDNDSTEINGGNYLLRITTAGTKTVIFSAPVTLADNADWLLLTVPDTVLPGAIKVLVAQSDDDAQTVTEIASQ